MYLRQDEDEWETVVHHRTCTSCQGDMTKCNGACNGMSGFELRRRKPEEIKRIKAERLRLKEDAILVEADAIRARRGMYR